MILRRISLISAIFLVVSLSAQKVSRVYKIDNLLNRIKTPDTLFVVNFWATWCKPCVQELPSFDSLHRLPHRIPVKVLLVSLDFADALETKVNPFLIKNKVQSECVLLDEINGNDFIDRISPNWGGAIPATLFKFGDTKDLQEKKLTLRDLEAHIRLME